MITINRTNPYAATRKLASQSAARPRAVDSLEVNQTERTPVVDRRKNRDRRQNNKGNGLLESRSGRDRRKSTQSPRPSIDIEA